MLVQKVKRSSDQCQRLSRAFLLAIACGLVVLLIGVSGSAQKPPAIKVVGTDSQGSIKLTTSTATTALRIPLELDSGEVKQLTAVVDDFVAPNATRVHPTVTLDGKPTDQAIDVSQKDRPILEISAIFPVAGEYKSNIVLFYSGRRADSVPLSVTRHRSDVTAQIEGLETVTTTKWFTANAQILFTVRETSGQRVTLYPPVLDGFALRESEKVRKEAHYKDILLDGQPVLTGHLTQKKESFVVEPQSALPVVLEIRGIEHAGEYSGTIRLSSSNGAPVTKEATVLVKTSGWIAAFWIFLGVLASFLIRRYTKEQRPKLQVLRRIRYAEDDLHAVQSDAGSLTRPTDRVFAGTRERLSRIERGVADGTALSGAAANLDEVEAKIRALPAWLSTGRILDAVEPQEIVSAPRAEWAVFAESYFLKVGSTLDIAPSLAKIEADITTAVSARIDKFKASVDAYKTAHTGATPEIDSNVVPRLMHAKIDAEAGNWTGMTTAFREARLAYIKVLAGQFSRLLTTTRPPLGFEMPDWETLRTYVVGRLATIQQATNPDHAASVYQQVNSAYFQSVATKLMVLVGSLKVAANAAEQPDFALADTALTAATLAAQKEDWDTGRAEYEKAMKAVMSILETRRKVGGGVESVVDYQMFATLIETLPGGVAMSPSTRLSPVVLRRQRTAEQISAVLERYDLLLNFALLLIACVVGVNLLWANDPVWGGWKAYTTALLWGLGLHQVGGSALEGLPAVTKKLTE